MSAERAVSVKMQWLWAFASGGLHVLLFPSPGLGFLSWVALAPLLFALVSTGVSLGRAFALGYLSGVMFYLGTCYWVYHVMHTYGGLSSATSVALTILFALYIALWHGLFGLILALMQRRQMFLGARVLWLAPFVWVACELGRTEVFGFPWALLGTAQVNNIAFAQLATVSGVWGLSFVIVVVNAAVVFGWVRKRNGIVVTGIVSALVLQSLSFWKPAHAATTHSARLVQQNIPILEKGWTHDYFDTTIAEITDLSKSKQPPSPEPRLIIWPESPAPFYTNDAKLKLWLSTLATDRSSFVLAGTLGILPSGASNSAYDVYNSATLVAPTGDFLDRYDKVHLVPFGEYVPFRSLLSFAESLTKQVSEFSRGSERKVFILRSAAGEKRLGLFICYETAFPNEVRAFATQGAQIFVNISNDAWLGDYGASMQHLNMARIRAIENRRWLLRATNNGITSSIDPYGRVIIQAPREIRTAIDAPYAFESRVTLYTRLGDWLAYLCAIITLAALFVRFRARAASIT